MQVLQEQLGVMRRLKFAFAEKSTLYLYIVPVTMLFPFNVSLHRLIESTRSV